MRHKFSEEVFKYLESIKNKTIILDKLNNCFQLIHNEIDYYLAYVRINNIETFTHYIQLELNYYITDDLTKDYVNEKTKYIISKIKEEELKVENDHEIFDSHIVKLNVYYKK